MTLRGPRFRRTQVAIPLPVERIHVEVTNRCNFDCEFCPQGDLARSSADMPLSRFRRICDQLEGGRIARELHFHVMGEPLLYRDLPEAVAHAAQRGVETVLTTNGSLLTVERGRELAAAGLHRLVVSLQTPDERSFRVRGARGLSFEDYEERIVEVVRDLRGLESRLRVVLALRTTAMPRAQGTDLSIIDDSESLRQHMLGWIWRTAPSGNHAPAQTDVVRGASVRRWNVLRVDDRFSVESRPLGGWVKGGGGKRFHPARFGTCHALSEMFAVLANGDLTFCCMDSEGGTRVGNVDEMSLAGFFQHPEVLRVYEGFQRFRILHPTCRRCIGEHGLIRSWGHQLGSIAYLRLWRKHFRQELGLTEP